MSNRRRPKPERHARPAQRCRRCKGRNFVAKQYKDQLLRICETCGETNVVMPS